MSGLNRCVHCGDELQTTENLKADERIICEGCLQEIAEESMDLSPYRRCYRCAHKFFPFEEIINTENGDVCKMCQGLSGPHNARYH